MQQAFQKMVSSREVKLILVVSLLILVNILSHHYRTTWDRTVNKDFTLNSATQSYLQSTTITERKAPIKIFAILRSSNTTLGTHLQRTLDLVLEANDTAFEIAIIDATRQPAEAALLASKYEVNLSREVVIIDAQTPDKQGSPFIRIVDTEEMLIWGKDSHGVNRVRAIQDENILLTHLIKAIEGEARNAYYLTDGFKFSDLAEESVLTTLKPIFNQYNIDVKPLSLNSSNAIPEDAKALFLLAPYTFSKEHVALLEKYADRNHSAIWISFDADQQPQQLRNFLRNYGIHPFRDIVVSKQLGKIKSASNVLIQSHSGFLKGLEGNYTTLRGRSSSFELDSDSQEWVARQIYKEPLLISDEDSWSENHTEQEPITFDPTYDSKGPLTLGVAVQQGDDQLLNQSRRMVVLGNNEFLLRKNITKEQIDFTSNLVNWLVARDDLIGIQPKDLSLYRISMTEDQKRQVQNLALVAIPTIGFLCAFLIWLNRKN